MYKHQTKKGELIICFPTITKKYMKQKHYIKHGLMLAVLAFAFSILLCDANSYAAKKTTASFTFGSHTYIAINDTDTVKLKNKVKKAAYSFTSKNKKVATVNKKGIVKGISAGKAKIVVTQKLNKKVKRLQHLQFM